MPSSTQCILPRSSFFDRAASVGSTVREILLRTYLQIGTLGLLLLVPLAVTSTDSMITRLGPKRWKRAAPPDVSGERVRDASLLPAGQGRRPAAACLRGRAGGAPSGLSSRRVLIATRERGARSGGRARGAARDVSRAALLDGRAAGLARHRRDARRANVSPRARRRPAALRAQAGSVPEHRPHHRRRAREPVVHDRLVAFAVVVLRGDGQANGRGPRVALRARRASRGRDRQDLLRARGGASSSPAARARASPTASCSWRAGVGITPLMAIVRYLTDTGWRRTHPPRLRRRAERSATSSSRASSSAWRVGYPNLRRHRDALGARSREEASTWKKALARAGSRRLSWRASSRRSRAFLRVFCAVRRP